MGTVDSCWTINQIEGNVHLGDGLGAALSEEEGIMAARGVVLR